MMIKCVYTYRRCFSYERQQVRKFNKVRAADLFNVSAYLHLTIVFNYCAEGRIFLSSIERDGIQDGCIISREENQTMAISTGKGSSMFLLMDVTYHP